MSAANGASVACETCTAAYPDVADDICDGHSPSVQELARQLAWMVQLDAPTPEQIHVFLDDALATVDWIGDRTSWHVARTGTLKGDPLWRVNGVDFQLRYDVDGHDYAIPSPAAGPCPECAEDVGRGVMEKFGQPRTVTLECLGCFHAWDVDAWWPSDASPDSGASS